MPDNLTVTIGADTSKLRADIRLATAEIRNLGTQLNAAVKAGDVAGARGIADTIGRLQSNAAGLTRELKATTGAMGDLGRTTAITQRSFRSFEGAILAIGKSFGGMRAGLIGFAAVLGAQGLGKIISETVDGLMKVQQIASNTTLPAATIQALGQAMLKTGLSVDQTQAALQSFSKASTEAKLKAGQLADNFGVVLQKPANEASSGIIRMTGATEGFIRVLKGGASNAVKDFSDPLTFLLGPNRARFNADPFKEMVAAAKALQDLKVNQPAAAAGFGQSLFGVDWDLYSKGLTAVANSPAWAQLKAQADAAFSPENMQRLADYNAAWGALQQTWDNLKIDTVLALFPAINAAIEWTTGKVQALIDIFEFLARTARATANIISSAPLPPSSADQSPGLAPFAAGGYIRGPGSGTSDSILARLSNGEFVMRAAAVDRWGPQFMSALNNLRNPFGYAGGGLVRPPRFATGGMVTATTADGVTVNLNFPGGSFALRGDREIVGGLTREARRAGMLSAGRMAGALA